MMESYIRYQISRINWENSNEMTAILKGIYAVLQSRGYTLYKIKTTIDKIIFENIEKTIKEYLDKEEL